MADEGAGPGKRWKRRKEARPQEIVAAALDLFVRQGFAATRVEDVAREAGVRPGTVYVYFENKEALLREVVYQSLVPVIAFARHEIEEHRGSASDLARSLVKRYWSAIGEGRYAGIPRLIMAEAPSFPGLARMYVEEVLDRARALARQVLELGVRRGEFRAMDLDQAALVVMAPVQYAAIHAFSLRPYDAAFQDVHRYLDTHLELFLSGILVR